MFLGTRLGLGVRALYELAILPGRRSAVRDLAQTCGTTEAVLRRILLRLRAAGYLEAQKGRAGGFRLVQDPQAIRIAAVAQVLEEKPVLTLGRPRRGLGALPPDCPTLPFWQALEERFLAELEKATLADVIALAGEAARSLGRARRKARSRRRSRR